MTFIQKQLTPHLTIGMYISPPGGADNPAIIPANRIFIEMVTEGAVYGFETEPKLHGVGTIFAHHAGQSTIHRTEGKGHYACFFIGIQYVDRSPAHDWPRCFKWDDPKAACQFADEMLRASQDPECYKEAIEDLIWSQFRFRKMQHENSMQSSKVPPRLASLMAYMDNHYGEDLSIQDLAEQANISASHLQATFREHLGITPHQHLIQIRMRAAQHKLVTTEEPIKSVAADVGYPNTENFCRAFKKHFSQSAVEYRNRYRVYDF